MCYRYYTTSSTSHVMCLSCVIGTIPLVAPAMSCAYHTLTDTVMMMARVTAPPHLPKYRAIFMRITIYKASGNFNNSYRVCTPKLLANQNGARRSLFLCYTMEHLENPLAINWVLFYWVLNRSISYRFTRHMRAVVWLQLYSSTNRIGAMIKLSGPLLHSSDYSHTRQVSKYRR